MLRYVEVLVKLPVKSLLRFTCVSKEWYALIKSSYFTAEDGEDLLLYDPASQKKRVIAEHGNDFMFVKAVDFMESLLPV
ncbi:hypothetical protein M0R45_004222 [Rubus argutus]|uniref:F-box domain-containing protein n=1 Tax=Rubus argutus TaxID=59490 RepID=A0AAW1YJ47_RUBAR